MCASTSYKMSTMMVLLTMFALNFEIVQPSAVLLYSIVIDVHANVPTTKQSGHMIYANSDGCMPLQPSPSTGNWYVILDAYNVCTLQKIQHAREAGYQLLISSAENRTITSEARSIGLPIIVTFPVYAYNLTKYSVSRHDDIYVTIITEADIHGEQDLRFSVYQDIPAPNIPGTNNHIKNGDYFSIMSPIISIICFLLVIFAAI